MPPYKPQELPIKNLNWERFVPLIGKANAEVARFDGLLHRIPNAAVLLSPLTTQEAVLSSKIEGTRATFQDVLEYEALPNPLIDKDKKDDIREILNYRKAIHYAVENLESLSLSNRLIKNIHAILLESVRGQNSDPGSFRKIQVFIGKSKNIEEAIYIPPLAFDVPDLMSNLEKYLHSFEKDIIVQAGILHAQFEMIHPFLDGNGRVGRILMTIFLYVKGILSTPSFYLSSYLERNRTEYYQTLNEVAQSNNWNQWLEFFLNAVIEQSKSNSQTVLKILELYEQQKMEIVRITHSQFAIKVLDFLFSYPIFSTSQFTDLSLIPRESSRKILRRLEDAGTISVIKKGRGNNPSIFVFPKLVEISA